MIPADRVVKSLLYLIQYNKTNRLKPINSIEGCIVRYYINITADEARRFIVPFMRVGFISWSCVAHALACVLFARKSASILEFF